jgi:uncharacterized membrane protein
MSEPRFSIQDAFGAAWAKLTANLGFLLGIALIYLVVTIGISMVGAFVQDINFTLGTLIRIGSYVISALFTAGAVKIAFALYDGDKPDFSQLYTNWNLVLFLIIGQLLWCLITIGGLILLIVPGVIWGIQFSFFIYYIIEDGLRPTDALRASSKLTKGAKGELLLLYVILVLMNIVGALIFGVGLLLTYPITLLVHVYVYRKLRGNQPAL